MSDRLLRPALVLGLMSAIGPFAIDMYLPAMPEIALSLNASVQGVQATIIGYFAAFGIAQMIYGPWADAAGRKAPLYAGIAVFALGALICALAPTANWLVAGRVVQGLGGAALMVVPRAIIRDQFTGPAATRLMAAMMLVISISPMLAPLSGSAVMAAWGWRAIFGVLLAASLSSLLLLIFAQPETLPKDQRQPVAPRQMLREVGHLLSDRTFMGLTMMGGFGMASFFVFISQASFVYTTAFGLTPTQFSLAFAVNAIGFFAASQFAARLGQRFGARAVVAKASLGFAIVTITLYALSLTGAVGLALCMAGLVLANACLGLVIPTAMVMALDDHGRIAGMASSLGGTVQMLTGGAMAALAGAFFTGQIGPMLGAIAICGAASFGMGRLALR